MNCCVRNITPLLPVRPRKDQNDLRRASRIIFVLLFLLSFQWKVQGQTTTNTSLTSTPTISCFNQPVTLTATVDQSLATGNVRFLAGTTVLGTATLNAAGQATLTLSDLPAGDHTIVAEYEGTAPFDGSISTEIIHTVNAPPAIISQPTPQIVFTGCNATFFVTAEGTEPFTYQWRRNGSILPTPTQTRWSSIM